MGPQPARVPIRRALEVEVSVNGAPALRLRMPSDLREKGRLRLPRALEIRTLELAVPWRVPGDEDERALGFAEVELQLAGG